MNDDKKKLNIDQIIEASSNCHAFNILGIVEDTLGRIKPEDRGSLLQEHIQNYIIKYFGDSANMRGLERKEVKSSKIKELNKQWHNYVAFIQLTKNHVTYKYTNKDDKTGAIGDIGYPDAQDERFRGKALVLYSKEDSEFVDLGEFTCTNTKPLGDGSEEDKKLGKLFVEQYY